MSNKGYNYDCGKYGKALVAQVRWAREQAEEHNARLVEEARQSAAEERPKAPKNHTGPNTHPPKERPPAPKMPRALREVSGDLDEERKRVRARRRWIRAHGGTAGF